MEARFDNTGGKPWQIESNPVRRGLRVKPEDYFWSGAADYAGLRAGPLGLDRESLVMIVCS
jgi:hypothetical protein